MRIPVRRRAKKLIDAACYWARGGKGTDHRLADLLALGVSEEAAQAWLDTQEAPEDPIFSVWSCNWPALHLFLGLKTQWRRAPFGGVIGLDYSAIPAFLRLRGIKEKKWRDLFEKLQAMEVAVLPIMNGK